MMKELFTSFLLAQVKIANPLPQVSADQGRVQLILQVVFTITGAISVLVITIAGFRYVLSHGDPNLIAQSKKAIIYALVGLVVSISATGIVTFVLKGL